MVVRSGQNTPQMVLATPQMVLAGLSLMWEGRQDLSFRGAQRQFPRHLRSAALGGILGRVKTGMVHMDTGDTPSLYRSNDYEDPGELDYTISPNTYWMVACGRNIHILTEGSADTIECGCPGPRLKRHQRSI